MAALDELGSTPDAVAAKLMSEGCKGQKFASTGCPIAVFLQKRFPDKTCVAGLFSCCVTDYSDPLTITRQWVRIPSAVYNFVRAFDVEAYPDLLLRKQA